MKRHTFIHEETQAIKAARENNRVICDTEALCSIVKWFVASNAKRLCGDRFLAAAEPVLLHMLETFTNEDFRRKLHAQDCAPRSWAKGRAHEVFAHYFWLPRRGEKMAYLVFCYAFA